MTPGVCVFPFSYYGVQHNECTDIGTNGQGTYDYTWCATAVCTRPVRSSWAVGHTCSARMLPPQAVGTKRAALALLHPRRRRMHGCGRLYYSVPIFRSLSETELIHAALLFRLYSTRTGTCL